MSGVDERERRRAASGCRESQTGRYVPGFAARHKLKPKADRRTRGGRREGRAWSARKTVSLDISNATAPASASAASCCHAHGGQSQGAAWGGSGAVTYEAAGEELDAASATATERTGAEPDAGAVWTRVRAGEQGRGAQVHSLRDRGPFLNSPPTLCFLCGRKGEERGGADHVVLIHCGALGDGGWRRWADCCKGKASRPGILLQRDARRGRHLGLGCRHQGRATLGSSSHIATGVRWMELHARHRPHSNKAAP